MGGGCARLGQAGDAALGRFEEGARLSREEVETVVYAVARAAAHYKARGGDGGAHAEVPSEPVVEPFAGRGKEVRPVEDLRGTPSVRRRARQLRPQRRDQHSGIGVLFEVV